MSAKRGSDLSSPRNPSMAFAPAADRAVNAFFSQKQRALHPMGLHGRKQGLPKAGKILQRDKFIKGGNNDGVGHGPSFY